MKHYTLYVSIHDYSKIIAAILDAFDDKQVETAEDGLQVTVTDKKWFSRQTLKFSLRTRDSDPKAFETMIDGMFTYYDEIRTKHQAVQQKLLMQISALNAAVGILSTKDMDERTFDRLLEMAAQLHGMLFIAPGTMLDHRGKLILDDKGHSELTDFRPDVTTELPEAQKKLTRSGEDRKNKTVQLLRSQGIPVNEHLPAIVGTEDAVIRSKEGIAQRAVALGIVSLYAGSLADNGDIQQEQEYTRQDIAQYGSLSFFTSQELRFLQSDSPDRADIIQFVWRYEGFWVLLWALGYVQELDFPAEMCDAQAAIRLLQQAGDYKTFCEQAVVRSTEEILDEADLIYRYHWACVNGRLNNQPSPGGLNDGVVAERHRALNWLIRYLSAEWDDVRTDT
ncbi:DUF4272 domain-containing protein [Paenibacillus sp. y28]|uniref:DUF4272 domain-containing protein n=1 Tax=Paenibacillus sp. y28 TaxID=3129110 RepID=UPI0030174C44